MVAQYAKAREQHRIPVKIAAGKKITLSPGEHSELIGAVLGLIPSNQNRNLAGLPSIDNPEAIPLFCTPLTDKA